MKEKRLRQFALLALLCCGMLHCSAQKQWTLEDCIHYALENNIKIKKSSLQKLSAQEDMWQSKAALLPSLNFNTSHNIAYRPWPESGHSTIANGSSVDKVYYNGSYNVNANWTVWNGNRNKNAIKANQLAVQQAALDSATTANTIQEQIAQLYVQILYSAEAINVNRQSLETSKLNEDRGQSMFRVGKMSKADVAQLTAQRAQDEYNIVAAESNLRNYKRQLKQLLQITNDEPFEVAIPTTTDEMALQEIPSLNDVYTKALELRPEIKSAQLAIESSNVNIKIAKGQQLPTIGLAAGFVTNTTSINSKSWGTQLKTNFDASAGVTVNVPIFDNRAAKTAINKARLSYQTSLLDLKDKETTLYATIENYWLEAVNNQNKLKAAMVSVAGQTESYELLSEQFRLGLKNIVELMTGKTLLLTAQQNELQSKYLAILNINLLKFYQSGILKN